MGHCHSRRRLVAYIKAPAPADVQGWEALHTMLACNVPNPRWAAPGGLTPEEEREHNKLLDASLTEEWGPLLSAAEDVRICWRDMTRAAVDARERMDAGRGMMRLIVRAWREVTDGLRAGAAKWEQRWAASEAGNPLARRLQFNDTVSYYGTEAGWRARAIFTWMRIVRASEKFGKPGDAATRGARMSNTGFTSSMRVARQHLSQRRSANPTHGVSRPKFRARLARPAARRR